MKYFLALFVIAIAIFFYTKSIKYSIEEITPSNLSVLGRPIDNFDLKGSDYGLKYVFFRDLSLLDLAPMVRNGNNGNLEVENGYKSNGRSTITIYDKITGYRYRLPYNDGKLINLHVQPDRVIKNDGSLYILPGAQKIIDDIIKEYGYVYKKSNLKSGVDIIIKEVGNFFIIGWIDMDEFGNVTNINFFAYNRDKYFK